MVQTEEATLTHTTTYIRGHKPTPSQESNTLSEVSCTTTLSSCSDKQEEDSAEGVNGTDVDIVRRAQVRVPTTRYCDTIVRNTSMDFDRIMIGTSRDSLLTLTGGDSCLDSYRRSVGSQDSARSSVNSQGSVLRGDSQLIRGSKGVKNEEGQQESVLRGDGTQVGGSLNSQENVLREKKKESGLKGLGAVKGGKKMGSSGPVDTDGKEKKAKGKDSPLGEIFK